MDSFDNFQYDSASSYGGGATDDTASEYTATTQEDNASSVDLSCLSISNDTENGHTPNAMRNNLDEDFDAVLDDLKDEGVVDLPPHACRLVPYHTFVLFSMES